MRFASLLSGGFITVIVVNPPEKELAKRTSVRWHIWVFLSFEVCQGTAGICHADPWGFSEAL